MNFTFWLPVLFFLGIGVMLVVLGCIAAIDQFVFQPEQKGAVANDLGHAS
jgi:hypothetical protein